MEQMYQVAQKITSNLLFSCVVESMKKLVSTNDALLLTVQDDDLVVVEVAGQLPSTLILSGCRTNMEEWSDKIPLSEVHPVLQPYQQALSFRGADGKIVGCLVFSAAEFVCTPELELMSTQVAHLLDINHSFASLTSWQDTLSKLKYQLSFFINTINNIFEPYDNLTMVRLYMEIIAEMFLFPIAMVYELQDHSYIPIAWRGVSQAELQDWTLDAIPFIKHPTLAMFPQRMSNLTPDQLGPDNYQVLQTKRANLVIPLQVASRPQYLITCHAANDNCSYNEDWRIISALSQTFNRAIELNEIRQELMQTNQNLDKKIFSLTTIYQAAEKILAIADLNQTADMALDMLMELFQSVTSAVFIHNQAEQRLELMALKSVMGNQDLSYWLALPNESPVSNQLVIDYTNPLARSEFLQLFPGFEAIEGHLLPLTVVHLQHQDRYFGFITLSTRMTEQPYSNDDFALLTMLSHSIAIALDNAWMLSKMEAQNQLLDRRLEELMAIQDALRVMRQATNLTEFCSLMANTLKLGMEAQLFAVLIDNGQHLINMYGSDEFCQQSGDQIALIATSTVITSNNGVKLLVVPIQHPGRLHAYLVISEFTNTVLDDGERTHLLDLIAAMLADTLAHLYELHCIEQQGVLDYSLLICHRLQQEIDQLAELGLTPCIIKFQHQEPAVVIQALGRAAMGIVIQPQTGILIGRLPATQLLPLLEPLTNNLVEINELSPEAIFLTAVPSDCNENSSIPKYGAMI